MFVRWLHKSWKYFWRIVFGLLLTIVVLGGFVIGLLQLDLAQNYLVDRIERQIEDTYKVNLSVDEIDGFLPFQLNMHDVVLVQDDDSATTDTLASITRLESKIDIWGLLQNKISITGFSLDEPRIRLRSDEGGRLRLMERRSPNDRVQRISSDEPWLSKVEIIAPDVAISDGYFSIHSVTRKNQIGNLPQSFSLTNIDTELFVDWSEEQRYLDIESFSAETENLKMGKLAFSGQLYSDQQLLEFNSFYLTLGDSRFLLNGEIDGTNLLQPDFVGQLLTSQYNLSVDSDVIYLEDLTDFSSKLPNIKKPLTLDIQADGTTDSLWVDRARIGIGESYVNFNGSIKNLRQQQNVAYEIRLDHVNLQKPDADQLFDSLLVSQYQALENITASGKASGNTDSVQVDLAFSSPLGELQMEGYSQLKRPYHYSGTMSGKNVDLSPFFRTDFDTTALNFDAQLEGAGITFEDAVSTFNVAFNESRIDSLTFNELSIQSSLANGLWNQKYSYQNGNESVTGSGWVDFSREEPPVSVQGNANNIDLAKYLGRFGIASSQLNFDYNIELQGLKADRIQGRANLDIKPSVIDGDTVRSHQLYMDLNSPDNPSRTFRLTSSLFDMNMSGQINPSDIIDQADFWIAYLKNRFKAEILMDLPVDSQVAAVPPSAKNVVFDGSIQAKDLSLIKKYFPDFPTIDTDSQLNFNVNTDGTRLLLSAKMQADTLIYDALNFSDSRTQFTASFRSDRILSEFSSIDFEADISALETETVDLDSMVIDLAVKQDSVYFTQHIGAISDDARFRMALKSNISDSSIATAMDDFYLGNEKYAWTSDGQPSFTYLRNGNIDFNGVSFQNRSEYFRMQGILSKNRSDSLTYMIRDVNLSRISDLVKGEIDFSGILNGTLITRSLTRQPTIQGDLNVNHFALNDRMIGDVRFNSSFNPDQDRFDTQIRIVTDTTKYENYLEGNDDVGQNISLDGYFVTPNPEVRQDTVYYFDANIEQIDMWIIPLIADNVFAEMEGQATGQGYITGNLDDFDFHADFQTQNVFTKPEFVNTNYFVGGPVQFDRHDGVILDSLSVMDTKGGTGTLWGTVDLNDFDPLTYLDLSLQMNNLQFLNNKYDPDVPFYGNVSGSGLVRLTGSNTDFYMRTPDPVQVTSDSDVSIPLLEETELEQSGGFIRFVDSFDDIDKKSTGAREAAESGGEEQIEELIQNMTFSERFDLDLQFEASDNLTVNLIFDPVTGEILTAGGTGQLRITMQDQEVQMFGQYNIEDGDYQFVTGEIISRQLQLEPGGTIVWEGPPDNARLDISAVYNARPDISTLVSDPELGAQNQNGGQQVPIDLIVEINGTLNSVENNYYFRLPTSLELSSNSTLQYTLNQINRDEQQKLLQATSILFTGQFIPTQGTGSPTASLSQSLTRGSTVLNPLLSNQVISPLLSNQINALLNSDVSRLDIDFNLNAYNEVDLGIALRLYNDRLILRREGLITGGGPESSLGDRIGDLNATYRIRRGLSLTAFHRQDRVLSNLQGSSQAGDVTPSVDGVGLEANLQFNTWKKLLDDVSRIFKSIFGGKKKDDEEKQQNLIDQKAREETE